MSGKPQLDPIKDLEPGAHVCFLYETEKDHRALLTQYLRQGLDRGEKVLYIADARPADAILKYLRDDGVTVEPYLTSGQLGIRTASDTYLPGGVFDPNKMIAQVRRETERALAEGYKALRGTAEMTWALRGLPGSQRLMEYESKLNTFFAGGQCLGLCQYDQRCIDLAMLEQVLSTHPIVAMGAKLYDNLHYTPPDVREHEDARDAPRPQGETSMPRRKVLMLKDDQAIRDVFYVLSTSLGCRGDIIHDSRQALASIKRESFDAVLLELRCSELPPEQLVSEIIEVQSNLVGRLLVITGEVADPETLAMIEEISLVHGPWQQISRLWNRLQALLGISRGP